jgi:inosine-uridine nucleoside N-ribohydrolase
MARKVILIADPGIDTAFALVLALHDPQLDVLAIAPTAGNVSAEQATNNVHVIVETVDPPRLPRLGAALPLDSGHHGTKEHGPTGLGCLSLTSRGLHNARPVDKLLVEEVRQHKGEVSVVVLGPLTALAHAMDREADFAKMLKSLVIVGGSWREPGDAGPMSEFHMHFDPVAARRVLQCGVPMTLLPLDITRQALFAPAELDDLVPNSTPGGSFLRKMVPFGVHATAAMCGIEGYFLKDVLGVVAAAMPQWFHAKPMTVDVETHGELTRGMTVFDLRPQRGAPNVDVVQEVDMPNVRKYLRQVFHHPG